MNKYLECMQKTSIPINTTTLCLGFKKGYIDYQNFKTYSLLKFLSESETLRSINLELFETKDIIELNNKIKVILANTDNKIIKHENEKWLWTTLTLLKKQEKNNEKLLDKIAEIYADFEYPEQMTPFINYMPSEADLTSYTPQQAQNRLINLCDVFLKNLEKKLVK